MGLLGRAVAFGQAGLDGLLPVVSVTFDNQCDFEVYLRQDTFSGETFTLRPNTKHEPLQVCGQVCTTACVLKEGRSIVDISDRLVEGNTVAFTRELFERTFVIHNRATFPVSLRYTPIGLDHLGKIQDQPELEPGGKVTVDVLLHVRIKVTAVRHEGNSKEPYMVFPHGSDKRFTLVATMAQVTEAQNTEDLPTLIIPETSGVMFHNWSNRTVLIRCPDPQKRGLPPFLLKGENTWMIQSPPDLDQRYQVLDGKTNLPLFVDGEAFTLPQPQVGEGVDEKAEQLFVIPFNVTTVRPVTIHNRSTYEIHLGYQRWNAVCKDGALKPGSSRTVRVKPGELFRVVAAGPSNSRHKVFLGGGRFILRAVVGQQDSSLVIPKDITTEIQKQIPSNPAVPTYSIETEFTNVYFHNKSHFQLSLEQGDPNSGRQPVILGPLCYTQVPVDLEQPFRFAVAGTGPRQELLWEGKTFTLPAAKHPCVVLTIPCDVTTPELEDTQQKPSPSMSKSDVEDDATRRLKAQTGDESKIRHAAGNQTSQAKPKIVSSDKGREPVKDLTAKTKSAPVDYAATARRRSTVREPVKDSSAYIPDATEVNALSSGHSNNSSSKSASGTANAHHKTGGERRRIVKVAYHPDGRPRKKAPVNTGENGSSSTDRGSRPLFATDTEDWVETQTQGKRNEPSFREEGQSPGLKRVDKRRTPPKLPEVVLGAGKTEHRARRPCMDTNLTPVKEDSPPNVVKGSPKHDCEEEEEPTSSFGCDGVACKPEPVPGLPHVVTVDSDNEDSGSPTTETSKDAETPLLLLTNGPAAGGSQGGNLLRTDNSCSMPRNGSTAPSKSDNLLSPPSTKPAWALGKRFDPAVREEGESPDHKGIDNKATPPGKLKLVPVEHPTMSPAPSDALEPTKTCSPKSNFSGNLEGSTKVGSGGGSSKISPATIESKVASSESHVLAKQKASLSSSSSNSSTTALSPKRDKRKRAPRAAPWLGREDEDPVELMDPKKGADRRKVKISFQTNGRARKKVPSNSEECQKDPPISAASASSNINSAKASRMAGASFPPADQSSSAKDQQATGLSGTSPPTKKSAPGSGMLYPPTATVHGSFKGQQDPASTARNEFDTGESLSFVGATTPQKAGTMVGSTTQAFDGGIDEMDIDSPLTCLGLTESPFPTKENPPPVMDVDSYKAAASGFQVFSSNAEPTSLRVRGEANPSAESQGKPSAISSADTPSFYKWLRSREQESSPDPDKQCMPCNPFGFARCWSDNCKGQALRASEFSKNQLEKPKRGLVHEMKCKTCAKADLPLVPTIQEGVEENASSSTNSGSRKSRSGSLPSFGPLLCSPDTKDSVETQPQGKWNKPSCPEEGRSPNLKRIDKKQTPSKEFETGIGADKTDGQAWRPGMHTPSTPMKVSNTSTPADPDTCPKLAASAVASSDGTQPSNPSDGSQDSDFEPTQEDSDSEADEDEYKYYVDDEDNNCSTDDTMPVHEEPASIVRRQPPPRPPGLENITNSCHMNSALQFFNGWIGKACGDVDDTTLEAWSSAPSDPIDRCKSQIANVLVPILRLMAQGDQVKRKQLEDMRRCIFDHPNLSRERDKGRLEEQQDATETFLAIEDSMEQVLGLQKLHQVERFTCCNLECRKANNVDAGIATLWLKPGEHASDSCASVQHMIDSLLEKGSAHRSCSYCHQKNRGGQFYIYGDELPETINVVIKRFNVKGNGFKKDTTAIDLKGSQKITIRRLNSNGKIESEDYLLDQCMAHKGSDTLSGGHWVYAHQEYKEPGRPTWQEYSDSKILFLGGWPVFANDTKYKQGIVAMTFRKTEDDGNNTESKPTATTAQGSFKGRQHSAPTGPKEFDMGQSLSPSEATAPPKASSTAGSTKQTSDGGMDVDSPQTGFIESPSPAKEDPSPLAMDADSPKDTAGGSQVASANAAAKVPNSASNAAEQHSVRPSGIPGHAAPTTTEAALMSLPSRAKTAATPFTPYPLLKVLVARSSTPSSPSSDAALPINMSYVSQDRDDEPEYEDMDEDGSYAYESSDEEGNAGSDNTVPEHKWLSSGLQRPTKYPLGLENRGNSCHMSAALHFSYGCVGDRVLNKINAAILAEISNAVADQATKCELLIVNALIRIFQPMKEGEKVETERLDSMMELIFRHPKLRKNNIHGQQDATETYLAIESSIESARTGKEKVGLETLQLEEAFCCSHCDELNRVHRPEESLWLDPVEGASVESMIANYLKTGSKSLQCLHCEESNSGGYQYFAGDHLPDAFNVFIKRFNTGAEGNSKDTTGFDLQQSNSVTLHREAPGDSILGTANYALTQCIVHIGSGMSSGHYKYARLRDDRCMWDEYDDRNIHSLDTWDEFASSSKFQGYSQGIVAMTFKKESIINEEVTATAQASSMSPPTAATDSDDEAFVHAEEREEQEDEASLTSIVEKPKEEKYPWFACPEKSIFHCLDCRTFHVWKGSPGKTVFYCIDCGKFHSWSQRCKVQKKQSEVETCRFWIRRASVSGRGANRVVVYPRYYLEKGRFYCVDCEVYRCWSEGCKGEKELFSNQFSANHLGFPQRGKAGKMRCKECVEKGVPLLQDNANVDKEEVQTARWQHHIKENCEDKRLKELAQDWDPVAALKQDPKRATVLQSRQNFLKKNRQNMNFGSSALGRYKKDEENCVLLAAGIICRLRKLPKEASKDETLFWSAEFYVNIVVQGFDVQCNTKEERVTNKFVDLTFTKDQMEMMEKCEKGGYLNFYEANDRYMNIKSSGCFQAFLTWSTIWAVKPSPEGKYALQFTEQAISEEAEGEEETATDDVEQNEGTAGTLVHAQANTAGTGHKSKQLTVPIGAMFLDAKDTTEKTPVICTVDKLEDLDQAFPGGWEAMQEGADHQFETKDSSWRTIPLGSKGKKMEPAGYEYYSTTLTTVCHDNKHTCLKNAICSTAAIRALRKPYRKKDAIDNLMDALDKVQEDISTEKKRKTFEGKIRRKTSSALGVNAQPLFGKKGLFKGRNTIQLEDIAPLKEFVVIVGYKGKLHSTGFTKDPESRGTHAQSLDDVMQVEGSEEKPLKATIRNQQLTVDNFCGFDQGHVFWTNSEEEEYKQRLAASAFHNNATQKAPTLVEVSNKRGFAVPTFDQDAVVSQSNAASAGIGKEQVTPFAGQIEEQAEVSLAAQHMASAGNNNEGVSSVANSEGVSGPNAFSVGAGNQEEVIAQEIEGQAEPPHPAQQAATNTGISWCMQGYGCSESESDSDLDTQ